MTDINKPVRRHTTGRHRGLRFVVSIEPGDVIGFRAERKRRTFYTTLAACFDMAVRQQHSAKRKSNTVPVKLVTPNFGSEGAV